MKARIALKVLRTVLKLAGVLLALLVLTFIGFRLYVELTWSRKRATHPIAISVVATPARLARGKVLVSMSCVTCHYDQKTSELSGHELLDMDKALGPIYSHNLTKHPKALGRYTDNELAYLLRTGIRRDGFFIGPFMTFSHFSDEDLISIIAFLRSDDPWVAPLDVEDRETKPSFFLKRLLSITWHPAPPPAAPIPTPPLTDQVAYGRYLVAIGHCFGCHAADYDTLNFLEPEKSGGYLSGGLWMPDGTGRWIASANLTMAPTGLGKWTEDEFVQAVRTGVRADGKALRYPMVAYSELSAAEVRAIFSYLKTVPRIAHDVPRNWERDATSSNASDGERLYARYACVSCHGDAGVGICDLRLASERYPTDEQLSLFLHDASKFVVGTKMPTWQGVIAESEYPPLIAHIRRLEQRYRSTH